MKYLIIATLLLFSCKKENQTLMMVFEGNMSFCKGNRKTQSQFTIYAYEKRKDKGSVIVKLQGIDEQFIGNLVKPEKGEQFRFRDDNFGLGIIKDNRMTLTYTTPICFYVFKGEKK